MTVNRFVPFVIRDLLITAKSQTLSLILLTAFAFSLAQPRTLHGAELRTESYSKFVQTPIQNFETIQNEVEWKDIASWQLLESRWALALDATGKTLAIYDLSFPSLQDRIELATIGKKINSTNPTQELLQEAKKYSNLFNQEERDALKSLNEEIQNLKTDPLLSSSSFNEQELSKAWNALPLNSGVQRSTENEIRLTDINWSKVMKDPSEMESLFTEVVSDLNEEVSVSGTGIDRKVIAQSLLFRKQGKEVHVIWDPPVRLQTLSRPKKLVDLRWTPAGFKEGLYWQALETGLDKVADLIQAPFLAGIIKTGLDRFFHYHKMLYRVHQNQMLEYLNDIYDQDLGIPGVFDPHHLSFEEKKLGLEAIIFSQTSLSSVYKWLWRKPFQEFLKDEEKSRENFTKNLNWYESRSIQNTYFGYRFAFRDSQQDLPQENSWIVTPGSKALRSSAKDDSSILAFNPEKPDQIFKTRLVREIITIGIVFSTHFMPGVGGPIRTAYKKVFQSPIDQQVGYEARLFTHLEKTAPNELILRTLFRGRVNPLVLDLERSAELIRLRRADLGI